MRRFIVIFILMILSFSLPSIDIPSTDDPNWHYVKAKPVSFVANRKAFFGFSESLVSSVGPVTDSPDFEFTFNSATEKYETSDIYYYVQAFQNGLYTWKVTFGSAEGPFNQISNDSATIKNIKYAVKAGSELLPTVDYVKDVKAEKNGDKTVGYSGSLQINKNDSGASIPDYCCGKFVLEIPGDTEFDDNLKYSGQITITLGVD